MFLFCNATVDSMTTKQLQPRKYIIALRLETGM